DEFKSPDFEEVHQRLNRPVIFDGRNLYRLSQMRREGFDYFSVGRPELRAAK
ncbi:MAG: UDP-glucose 6-dehydrogenase, partial [Planctomycetota bacterium]|nr:UDP-glucose 6-dehydrogenase [Planctomycetota bacterium]